MGELRVISYRDARPEGFTVIETTSRSDTWSRGLSPFFVGPVEVPGFGLAKNVENAWQYSKVYPEYHDAENDLPRQGWAAWARRGFESSRADRYPMGKGARPLYSWWDSRRMDYITARKNVYVPVYANAVAKTAAWRTLRDMYDKGTNIALLDFDAYDHVALGLTIDQVMSDPKRKAGHAFVLYGMLTGEIEYDTGCTDCVHDKRCTSTHRLCEEKDMGQAEGTDLPDFASTLAAVQTGRVGCITGHRPGSFPFKYDESSDGCIAVKRALRRMFEMAYNQGFRTFITGMALGVDIWAAEALLNMQRNPAYSDIVIVGAVPCLNQECRWPEASQKRYRDILTAINTWGYVSKVTFDADKGCMTARNIAMIDPSDVVFGIYNGQGHTVSGGQARANRGSGTGHAVAYALNHGKKVLCYDWVNGTLALLPALSEAPVAPDDDIPY